ncbi:hypothetical protein F190043G2_29200 [Blautia caecimuris]
MFLRFFFYFIGKTVYSVSVLPANEKGDQKKFENLVDRLTTVCYSEKCYIMARYACLPENINRIML